MAKDIVITKYMKITEAQQYMILSVLGASLVLGVSIALILRFTRQIAFNTKVIMEEEKAIVDYSQVISDIGICKKPRSSTYSDSELAACDPSSIDVSEVPNTLRSEVLENLANNDALNSVPKDDGSGDTSCINPDTNKSFTYEELNANYDAAKNAEEKQVAINLIKSCSALRVIPDALPASENTFALMASLNKLFLESNWEPQSLAPSNSATKYSSDSSMSVVPVTLSVSADSATTLRVLNAIERSIREFDITSASIEWGGDNNLNIGAVANAYYVSPTSLPRYNTTITEESVTSRVIQTEGGTN